MQGEDEKSMLPFGTSSVTGTGAPGQRRVVGLPSISLPISVTPAVLPTPNFSPIREVVVEYGKGGVGIRWLWINEGFVRLRSPGQEFEPMKMRMKRMGVYAATNNVFGNRVDDRILILLIGGGELNSQGRGCFEWRESWVIWGGDCRVLESRIMEKQWQTENTDSETKGCIKKHKKSDMDLHEKEEQDAGRNKDNSDWVCRVCGWLCMGFDGRQKLCFDRFLANSDAVGRARPRGRLRAWQDTEAGTGALGGVPVSVPATGEGGIWLFGVLDNAMGGCFVAVSMVSVAFVLRPRVADVVVSKPTSDGLSLGRRKIESYHNGYGFQIGFLS
nr:WD repeat-containing protein 24 [Ipomoea batatas]